MASLLLGFHKNMPTMKPIALGEYSEPGIGLAAAWANELDQIKALVNRAVGLYQTYGSVMNGTYKIYKSHKSHS